MPESIKDRIISLTKEVHNEHEKFLNIIKNHVAWDKNTINNILGIAHEINNVCSRIKTLSVELEEEKKVSLLAFPVLCESLADELSQIINNSSKTATWSEKMAEILNPIKIDVPKQESKINIISKANSLAKHVYPKLIYIFSKIPKDKEIKYKLLNEIKELESTVGKFDRVKFENPEVGNAISILYKNIIFAMKKSL